jgi:hypothetical protein
VTMIDEEVLSEALREAAEAIYLPDGASDRILVAAQVSTATSRSGERTVVPRISRRRVVLVAAIAALVIGGITASVANIPNQGSNSSSPDVHAASLPTKALSPSGAPGSFAPEKSAVAPARKAESSIPPGTVGQSARVEANGSVDLTIGNGTLQSVLGKLTVLASAEGGFVASTQAQLGPAGSGSSSSGVIVLRVPEANFGALVTDVQRDGRPTSVTTTSQDVTGQYVNLQAQIAALQSSRQQYLTIMTRASSIGDILAVQSQLDTIQSEIDQLQGQLNVLDNETTYGTLTVSLTEPGKSPPPPPRPHPASSGLLKAWDKSVGGFVSGIEWMIRIAGPLLLVLLCLAGLLFLGRFAWRAARRQML